MRALIVAAALAGCASQSTAPADLSTANDLSTADRSIADLAMPDLSSPDLSITDLSSPDLSIIDLSITDSAIVDFAMPDLATPPDLTPVPVLSTVNVTQQPNHRALNVTWSAGGYSGAINCQVSLNGVAVGAPVACAAQAASVNLPWLDGQTAWNVALTVAVTPSAGAAAQTSFTPACAPEAGSATSTPDIDEDCDGNWDNTIVTWGFQTPPLEITYCNGTGGFVTFDLGTQPDSATCLSQCLKAVNQVWDMTTFYYKNCCWDGPASTCWVGGTSICTSSTEQSYKWSSITVTTYY